MNSIRLLFLVILSLGLGRAACEVPNAQSFDLDWGEQTSIESLQGADRTITYWIKIGANSETNGVYLTYIGGAASEAEADNSIIFIRCNSVTCQTFESIWEYGGGTNQFNNITAAEVSQGSSWDGQWMFFAWSVDASALNMDIHVWRPEESVNGFWYTVNESLTSAGTGGSSGALYVFDNAGDANQQDHIALSKLTIYDRALTATEARSAALGRLRGGVAFDAPILNCDDNLHIGDADSFVKTGSGQIFHVNPPVPKLY